MHPPNQSKSSTILPLLIPLALVCFGLLPGAQGVVPPPAVPYDFNNDAHSDYLLYNSSTRQTAVWHSNNNVFIGGAYGPTIPVGWRVIDVADFNRDGNNDYALFNSSTRQTAIWYLSGVNGVTLIASAWGPRLPNGWALVATGEFNHDLKPDFVIFNATTRRTAFWYLSNNVFIGGAFGPTLPGGLEFDGNSGFWRVPRQ
jgi:FG-GAP-like repeat